MCAARDGTLPIDPLRGTEDWAQWSQLVQRALLAELIQQHILQGAQYDARTPNDARALLILYSNCSQSIRDLVTIQGHTSARNLYKQLESICDCQAGDPVQAYERFLKVTYGGNGDELINTFCNALADCKLRGVQISEFIKVWHFYRAVKPDFPEFKFDKHAIPCLETVQREFQKFVRENGERDPKRGRQAR